MIIDKYAGINDFIGKEIGKMMGETKIEENLEIMTLMNEYLDSLGYDGIYTQLDKGEDQFSLLTKWLNTFYGVGSKKGFDGYDNTDVDDLKTIAFDYLRNRNSSDGKEFRNLAEGNKDKHFFGDKEIWKNFSSKHYEILDRIPEESDADFNSNNLEKHLNARDNEFFETSKFGKNESEFIENLNNNKTLVGYNKASDAPEKLGNKVIGSLNAKSPSKILNHIINLLESIDVDKIPEEEVEEVQAKTKKIQQIGYQINKQL